MSCRVVWCAGIIVEMWREASVGGSTAPLVLDAPPNEAVAAGLVTAGEGRQLYCHVRYYDGDREDIEVELVREGVGHCGRCRGRRKKGLRCWGHGCMRVSLHHQSFGP